MLYVAARLLITLQGTTESKNLKKDYALFAQQMQQKMKFTFYLIAPAIIAFGKTFLLL